MANQNPTLSGGPGAPRPKPQKPKVYRRSFATGRTIMALMLREMSSTYGRTPAGFLWVVVEPVAAIALLTAVFSVAVRDPALGTSFALFYATGFLPFYTFLGLTGKIGVSLTFSRALMAYPSVTWLDAILARFILNTMADALVAILVLGGIIMIFDVRLIIDYPTVITALAMAWLFSLGVGMMNSYLFLRMPSWMRIFSIMMRPMFFLSGVFFLFESVPQPYRDWLWWNPVIHMTGLIRSGFYSNYPAEWVSKIYVFGIAFFLIVAAMVLLRKSHQDLLNL